MTETNLHKYFLLSNKRTTNKLPLSEEQTEGESRQSQGYLGQDLVRRDRSQILEPRLSSHGANACFIHCPV